MNSESVGFSWRRGVWSRSHGDCKSSSAGFLHIENMNSTTDILLIKLVTEAKNIIFQGEVEQYRLDAKDQEEASRLEIFGGKRKRTPEEEQEIETLGPRVRAAQAELERKQTSAALAALVNGVEVPDPLR